MFNKQIDKHVFLYCCFVYIYNFLLLLIHFLFLSFFFSFLFVLFLISVAFVLNFLFILNSPLFSVAFGTAIPKYTQLWSKMFYEIIVCECVCVAESLQIDKRQTHKKVSQQRNYVNGTLLILRLIGGVRAFYIAFCYQIAMEYFSYPVRSSTEKNNSIISKRTWKNYRRNSTTHKYVWKIVVYVLLVACLLACFFGILCLM